MLLGGAFELDSVPGEGHDAGDTHPPCEDRSAMVAKVPPITALLADDHTLFRRGLAEMLSTDEEITVVGEAGERGRRP